MKGNIRKTILYVNEKLMI